MEEQTRRFKGKPINDRPKEFERLLKLAKKGPFKINERYPDVKLDYAGFYLAVRLGDYFKEKDVAVEELKTILYESSDDNMRDPDIDREVYDWLLWYFPKMMRSVTKGYKRFVRGFQQGLPRETNRFRSYALDAIAYLLDFIRNGNRHCNYGARFLLNELDSLKGYIQKREYVGTLKAEAPMMSETPLVWDPRIEERTRKARKAYKKGGVPGYIDYMMEFVLANNRVHADHRVDEKRFLPKELWGKVKFEEPRYHMFTLPALRRLEKLPPMPEERRARS